MLSRPEQLLYFAYGSNMAPQRLQARVPSAEPLQRAQLAGHELRFHKHSRVDGSAKCDACCTGEAGHAVHGLLYRMDAAEKPFLDACEGLGRGYEIKQVELWLERGETVSAFTYYATDIESDLLPYQWYKEHVLRGAHYAGLSEAYIRAIAAVEAMTDPDRQRHARELAIYEAVSVSARE
jgi:gamma-glutamylcyclotransferase (GGCT)/AIG2-like uncharacterized protein YtfP